MTLCYSSLCFRDSQRMTSPAYSISKDTFSETQSRRYCGAWRRGLRELVFLLNGSLVSKTSDRDELYTFYEAINAPF